MGCLSGGAGRAASAGRSLRPALSQSRWREMANLDQQRNAPVWSRNGRELFFMAQARGADAVSTMMAVPIDTTPTFSPGMPSKLFSGNFFSQVVGVTYDVSPDGQRFLMVKGPAATAASSRILVVDNWIEELKARVPTN
jgi:hypothetical protein